MGALVIPTSILTSRSMAVLLKYLTLITAAALATFLCLWMMLVLISIETSRTPDVTLVSISTPAHSLIRKQEKRVVRETVKKILPSEPPPTPDGLVSLSETIIPTQSANPVRFSMADILGAEQIDLNMLPPITELVPMVVVQPIYPFVAVMKEIEGFVLVQFSVRDNGTVANAIILESEPRSTFDDAALFAIRKFKFQPRIVGGDPMSADEIQMRFAFTLESSYGR